MKIRRATVNDLDEILRLNKLLFEYERQFGDTHNLRWTYSMRGKKYFRKRLTNKGGIALIAEIERERVGYLVAWVSKNVCRSVNPICEIENMFVDEDFRRKGVGTALVSRFKKIAEDRGVRRIKVESGFPNEIAVKFYKAMGFGEFNLVMEGVLP